MIEGLFYPNFRSKLRCRSHCKGLERRDLIYLTTRNTPYRSWKVSYSYPLFEPTGWKPNVSGAHFPPFSCTFAPCRSWVGVGWGTFASCTTCMLLESASVFTIVRTVRSWCGWSVFLVAILRYYFTFKKMFLLTLLDQWLSVCVYIGCLNCENIAAPIGVYAWEHKRISSVWEKPWYCSSMKLENRCGGGGHVKMTTRHGIWWKPPPRCCHSG